MSQGTVVEVLREALLLCAEGDGIARFAREVLSDRSSRRQQEEFGDVARDKLKAAQVTMAVTAAVTAS